MINARYVTKKEQKCRVSILKKLASRGCRRGFVERTQKVVENQFPLEVGTLQYGRLAIIFDVDLNSVLTLSLALRGEPVETFSLKAQTLKRAFLLFVCNL